MARDIALIYRLNKNWQPGETKIKRAGGQTNRNYVIEHKNKKFFVRLPWESSVINRKIEAKNIYTLNRCQKLREILPKHYLYIYKRKNILNSKNREVFDLPDGTMVSEHIPNKIFTLSLFGKETYQEKLAKMFYVFHSSRVRFVNSYNVFRDELEKYRLAAQKLPIQKLLDAGTVSELKQIEEAAKLTIPIGRAVPTHNDFIFQNFIVGKNGKIYLLDFEYAGMNEKGGLLYDFAFLFADNFFRKPAINQDLFEKFLKVADRIYGKTLDRKQIWSLVLAVPVMQVWWGLLRYFDAKTKKEEKYFKNYILKRVHGISRLAKELK